MNTKLSGPVEENLVEKPALHATTMARQEGGLRDGASSRVEEADAAQGGALLEAARNAGEIHSEFAEGSDRAGQKALPAGFVDGGLHAVGHADAVTLSSERDGAG